MSPSQTQARSRAPIPVQALTQARVSSAPVVKNVSTKLEITSIVLEGLGSTPVAWDENGHGRIEVPRDKMPTKKEDFDILVPRGVVVHAITKRERPVTQRLLALFSVDEAGAEWWDIVLRSATDPSHEKVYTLEVVPTDDDGDGPVKPPVDGDGEEKPDDGPEPPDGDSPNPPDGDNPNPPAGDGDGDGDSPNPPAGDGDGDGDGPDGDGDGPGGPNDDGSGDGDGPGNDGGGSSGNGNGGGSSGTNGGSSGDNGGSGAGGGNGSSLAATGDGSALLPAGLAMASLLLALLALIAHRWGTRP